MWSELAGYARRSPSPHNTQPVRLRVLDDLRAEVVFVTDRGLPVGDPQGRFTHVTFGIFVESLRVAAHARGYELVMTPRGGALYDDPGPLRTVADLELRAADGPIADLDPELLLRRRTNRHPYNHRPVPVEVVAELQAEATAHGHAVMVSTDDQAIRWVKQLNRDALYHDLAHADYRGELDAWLRYSEDEARERRDGLSPGTLVLPGWLMRGMIRHHWLFSAPGLKQLTGQVYLRTMRGIPTVGWVQGDFASPDDWIRAGRLMLRLWLVLTRHGIEWQPYGSVITNDAARRSMVERFGMREGPGGRDMVWLLVRLGYCDHEPADSHRLPLEEVVR